MSVPIKLTEGLIAKIQKEFIEKVKGMKMFDGKITYTKSFEWDGEDRASIVFSAEAFAKMTMLVQTFDSEVAWHGVAMRDEENESRFLITDILVYPQIVTGATVNTDQEDYQTWLYTHEDDVFNNIRMQGHSHVNFSTSPSGVDLTHQEKILSQVDDDMFYIFMIWNKKFEKTIKIYDMKNNTLYENGDIDVLIGGEGCDLDAFIKGAKELVKNKPATVSTVGGGYTYNEQRWSNNGNANSSKTNTSGKSKPEIGSSSKKYNYGYDSYDRFSDDETIYGYGRYGAYGGK